MNDAIFAVLLISQGKVYVTHLGQKPGEGDLQDRDLMPMFLDILETASRFKLPDVELLLSNCDSFPKQVVRLESNKRIPLVALWVHSRQYATLTIPYSDQYREGCKNKHSAEPSLDELYKLAFDDPNSPAHTPWLQRKDIAFTRYNQFRPLYISPYEPLKSVPMLNGEKVKFPRLHVKELGQRYPQYLDVQLNDRDFKPMINHSRYRYLIYTDGFAVSTKMEFYAMLGSTVIKQVGPVTSYFMHALHPFEHFIPFYNRHPTDLIDSLLWARNHTHLAMKIARNLQLFARQHLTHDARICYWRKVFEEAAALLRYTPSCDSLVKMCVPLEERVMTLVDKTGKCGEVREVEEIRRKIKWPVQPPPSPPPP